MLEILNDANTDEHDRNMTLITLADALFPDPRDGGLGMDLEESEKLGAGFSEEMRSTLEEMDREEGDVCGPARNAMEEQGINQEQLAAKNRRRPTRNFKHAQPSMPSAATDGASRR